MSRKRNSYTAEEKQQIILSVLSRRNSIQKIAKEKGIIASQISIWKKQAEDAILERFQPRPRGRRKTVKPVEAKTSGKVMELRAELRKVRTKATRAESSQNKAQARIKALENCVAALADSMGCKLTKIKTRRKIKA